MACCRIASGWRAGMPRRWRVKACSAMARWCPARRRRHSRCRVVRRVGRRVRPRPGLPGTGWAASPAGGDRARGPYFAPPAAMSGCCRGRRRAIRRHRAMGCGRQPGAWRALPSTAARGPGNLVDHPFTSTWSGPVGQLGANAHGEVLEPGWVPGCYLGLLLDPAEDAEVAGVLVVAPAALLHPSVPQPDGTVLYELVSGHPDRAAGELVFLADLTMELRAWPTDTWSKVGVDPQAAAHAVVAGWQRGDLPGRRLVGLTAQEALALERPAMTYVRAQLGDRLQRQLTGPSSAGSRR